MTIVSYRFRVMGPEGLCFRVECSVRDRARVLEAMVAQGFKVQLLGVCQLVPSENPLSEARTPRWVGAT